MPKIKLTDTEQIARWKEVILGNLHTRFVNGMDEADFIKQYPNAPLNIIKSAFVELMAEAKVKLL